MPVTLLFGYPFPTDPPAPRPRNRRRTDRATPQVVIVREALGRGILTIVHVGRGGTA